MKSKIFAALVTLSLSTLVLATEAHLTSFNSNGSGCPVQNGKKVPFDFDGQWLTVELNEAYSIQLVKGTGISLEESHKNCAITLDLEVPGHRYAVERMVAWGTYQLAPNDQFVASINGFFAGSGTTFSTETEVLGPIWNQESYAFDSTVSASKLLWSACDSDRALTLNTAVRLAPKGKAGRYANPSKGSLDRVAYRFIYQKCY